MVARTTFGALSLAAALVLGGCNSQPKVAPDQTPPPENVDAKVATSSWPDPQQTQTNQKRALVIKHGWDIPLASALPQMAQEISDSPFEGIVFSGGLASRIFTGKKVPVRVIETALRPLDKLPKERDFKTFIILYVDSIEGGFSGPNLDAMIKNVEHLAKVAASKQVYGIAFDNEVYRGDPWAMPAACPGLDRKACGEVAFAAGKRMMDAVVKQWPDVVFLAFFGPWLNDPRTYTWIKRYAPQVDWSNANSVAGEFLAGVFAATRGKAASFVDGGELYGLRSRRDFQQTALWNRDIMVKDSPFFPDGLREAYSREMKVGFGVYDDRRHLFPHLPRLTPRSWRGVIRAARREADVVWVYTERHDWWRSDGKDWPDRSKEGCEGAVTMEWMGAAREAMDF